MSDEIESDEFYDLCQAYRHAPIVPPGDVIIAYEELKTHISKLLQSKLEASEKRVAELEGTIAETTINALRGARQEGIRIGFEAARARSTRRVRNMIDIDVGNKFKTVEDFLKSTDKGGK